LIKATYPLRKEKRCTRVQTSPAHQAIQGQEQETITGRQKK